MNEGRPSCIAPPGLRLNPIHIPLRRAQAIPALAFYSPIRWSYRSRQHGRCCPAIMLSPNHLHLIFTELSGRKPYWQPCYRIEDHGTATGEGSSTPSPTRQRLLMTSNTRWKMFVQAAPDGGSLVDGDIVRSLPSKLSRWNMCLLWS